MDEIAGWVAPVATTIAAMMTAANLGARITGWGFVVFTIGSVAWVIVSVGTGQTNLLATNGFLTLVNVVGIWRWLGRQAKYDDGGDKATKESAQVSQPSLIPLGKIAGARVETRDGEPIGEAVEAMIERRSGRINYVVVSVGGVGGVGETLHALPRDVLDFGQDAIVTRYSRAEIDALSAIERDNWPKSVAV